MWTRFYSPFWYENGKKNKMGKKKNLVHFSVNSHLFGCCLSYELLYIVNCNIRFLLVLKPFGLKWHRCTKKTNMVTLLLAIHQPFFHICSSPLFFKIFYSPSLALGQIAASVCMCVMRRLPWLQGVYRFAILLSTCK